MEYKYHHTSDLIYRIEDEVYRRVYSVLFDTQYPDIKIQPNQWCYFLSLIRENNEELIKLNFEHSIKGIIYKELAGICMNNARLLKLMSLSHEIRDDFIHSKEYEDYIFPEKISEEDYLLAINHCYTYILRIVEDDLDIEYELKKGYSILIEQSKQQG